MKYTHFPALLLFSFINFVSLPITQSLAEITLPTPKNLTLASIANSSYNILTGNVIKEAYRRIGYEVKINYLPGKRALKMSSNGELGGEVSRIYSIGDLYKSLIRVPVPFMSLKGTVFTIDPNVKVRTKADLSKYRIGSLRGVVYSDKLAEGYNCIHGKSVKSLLRMLKAGRIDLVIITETSGLLSIAKWFADEGIRIEGKPLIEIPVYHYLHESNKRLVPQIEKILRNMLESGDIARMQDSYISNQTASFKAVKP